MLNSPSAAAIIAGVEAGASTELYRLVTGGKCAGTAHFVDPSLGIGLPRI